jgi:hypothetical protein
MGRRMNAAAPTMAELQNQAAALHQLAQADEQVAQLRKEAEARGYVQATHDLAAMVDQALDETRDNIVLASRAAFLKGWRQGIVWGGMGAFMAGSGLTGLLLGVLKG